MQVAPNLSALRVPVHFATAFGPRQRRSPTGAAANGIPLKTRTSGVDPATPEINPASVRTGSGTAAASVRADANRAKCRRGICVMLQVTQAVLPPVILRQHLAPRADHFSRNPAMLIDISFERILHDLYQLLGAHEPRHVYEGRTVFV